MITFLGSPGFVRIGFVSIDAETAHIQHFIRLLYNPDTLTRSLQIKSISEDGDWAKNLRLTGPSVETIKLEAEIDTMKGPNP